jgi:hypothetical protein
MPFPKTSKWESSGQSGHYEAVLFQEGLINEIRDHCNFVFGTNTWPGPSAFGNQMWNGFVFDAGPAEGPAGSSRLMIASHRN